MDETLAQLNLAKCATRATLSQPETQSLKHLRQVPAGAAES